MGIRKKNKIRRNAEDWILDIIIYSILILLAIACLYPLWYVIVASLSSDRYIASQGALLLWPEFNFTAYKLAFQDDSIMGGFLNSVKIELLSLPVNIFLTMLCGYFMAQKGMKFKKPILTVIMITMFVDGGLVPHYLNIQQLGLYDTIWALVLPGSLSVYNAIICKTAIEGIPESLPESAYIDGANDMTIIWKIILPLIKPTAAVLLLYYGVAHWNAWFNASIYLKSSSKLRPAQLILRYLMVQGGTLSAPDGAETVYSAYAETIQYAAIVIITVPILCVYPFLQKHFAKGVMIGAVKG